MATKKMSTETFKTEIFDYTQGQEFIFNKEQPVILNFTASWCGPCKAFAPALEAVSDEYAEKLKIFKVDIDENPELPSLFGVRSVPTTIFFYPNKQPSVATGNIGKEGLEKAIKDLFNIG